MTCQVVGQYYDSTGSHGFLTAYGDVGMAMCSRAVIIIPFPAASTLEWRSGADGKRDQDALSGTE